MPVNQDQLLPNEFLGPDQAITSANGRYRFIYQGDGNLVLYRNDGSYLWDSATDGRPVGRCIMQGDGNLVIYGPDGQYVWDSATDGNPGSGLWVQDDGNVVIYRPDGAAVWATNTWVPTGPVAQGDDMQPGEVLNPDQAITSANGQYTFVYQGDGNLVLYYHATPLWASNTDGRPVGVCIMQGDGNLVLYAPGGQPIWSSDTWQHPGSRLVVQDDGKVVIYRPDNKPVWATRPVAIVLSGGGAKGDFQVGAVRFLYDHLYDQGIRPGIICGASVGAINGTKLAEGEGTADQGLPGLEAIWLALQNNANMWLEEEWLGRIDPRLKNALVGTGGAGSLSPPAEKWGILGPIGDLVDAINKLGWLTDEGVAILEALAEFLGARSLFNLEPIRQRFVGGDISEERVRNWSQEGAKKLRLAAVSLDSGNLRYVTESGEILERDNRTVVPELVPTCQHHRDRLRHLNERLARLQQGKILQMTDESGNPVPVDPELIRQIEELNEAIEQEMQALQQCLEDTPPAAGQPVRVSLGEGALASSSIAGVFPPVPLGSELYVDAGFREIVPIQAAIDLGADTIHVVLAGKTGTNPQPMAGKHLLDFVKRALADISIAEIGFSDINARPGGFGPRTVRTIEPAVGPPSDNVALRIIEPAVPPGDPPPYDITISIIEPTVDLHDIMTIDPGLIRISMAYGFMRAGDVFNGVRPADRLWQLSDEIAVLRKDTWRLECIVHGKRVPGETAEGLSDRIAELKRERLVLERLLEKNPHDTGTQVQIVRIDQQIRDAKEQIGNLEGEGAGLGCW